jgi:phenylalanyl-tRNA synthetase beta chain
VQEVIESFSLVDQVTLFDVYSGEQVPQGKKSLAFSIRYQSLERTLTDEEVNQAHQQITDRLQRDFGATLRS